MYVDINKNAVLFYKAFEDIWCAERTYNGSPNNAVWSCCQAAEKVLKGFLQCYGISHDDSMRPLDAVGNIYMAMRGMKRKPADILAGTTGIFERRSKQLTLERTIAERGGTI
jgi:hypothetical protein